MIRYTSQKQISLPGFETPFEEALDPNNRWIKLGEIIPWDELVIAYCRQMSDEHGRPAKNPRLIIGAMILKHKQKWSDRETVLQIQENPYLQKFCGFPRFTLKQPFSPSLFVEIRSRMGEEVFNDFEQALQTRLESIKSAKQHQNQNDGECGSHSTVSEDTMSNQDARAEPTQEITVSVEVVTDGPAPEPAQEFATVPADESTPSPTLKTADFSEVAIDEPTSKSESKPSPPGQVDHRCHSGRTSHSLSNGSEHSQRSA